MEGSKYKRCPGSAREELETEQESKAPSGAKESEPVCLYNEKRVRICLCGEEGGDGKPWH